MSTQIVLITGALTGIGRATALAFASEGGRIMVSGRRDDAGEALASELRGLGVEAEFARRRGRVGLLGEQACGRGTDEVRGPRRSGIRRAGQRGRSWADRDRATQPGRAAPERDARQQACLVLRAAGEVAEA